MKNNKIGFDNELYLKLQSEKILERIDKFNDKLYLELGGKLFDDYHASRVLPGFDPNAKLKLLERLKDKVEVIFCISANDIEKNKTRADLGLSYENEVLGLIQNLRDLGLFISAFVITMFKGQSSATKFGNKLLMNGERVFYHKHTKGYPNEVDTIVSEEGYGANPYIETSRPLVVVTSPAPASGKLATCLSQLYHEYKRNVRAGFAKFETFPVWNLPLKHPINEAYEAATADVKDINQIDPYHFNSYGQLAVNYNRDIAVFPILSKILKRITGEDVYKSPTDMGVNMIADAITDDEVVREAANKEIIRRYYNTECDYKKGQASAETLNRMHFIMAETELDTKMLTVTEKSIKCSKESGYPCIALELPNGKIVYGKTKSVVSACGAVILNALRFLSGLGDDFDIISDDILLPIVNLRKNVLKEKNSILNLDDILIALSVSANKNEKAKLALNEISKLAGCEAHVTYIISQAEENTLKKLNINITCEPQFLNNDISQN
ncbi:MAG: DUF1846 domain-containing protein [Clostridia bacterium]|nr:DUF1846 domain-containing protein [Clostridia bacterium]